MPVYTTREPHKDDKTRQAVSKAVFEKLGPLLYTTEYNNGHSYGIVEEMVKIKRQGKVALIVLPVGEKGLKDLLLNPKYRISRFTLLYQDLASASRMLKGRMENSGETPEMISQRIVKAVEDQKMLKNYLECFNDSLLVREYKDDSNIKFEDFLRTFAKKIV